MFVRDPPSARRDVTCNEAINVSFVLFIQPCTKCNASPWVWKAAVSQNSHTCPYSNVSVHLIKPTTVQFPSSSGCILV